MNMLKSFVASTKEVDDIKQAVQEILDQIPLDALKTNTFGIVACHYEFVFSGVLEGVAQALPFDTVGTISSAQGTARDIDAFELVVTVLTSDEVEFATALSEPLVENTREIVGATYQKAADALGEKPSLILIHGPLMLQNNGDDYLAELDEVSDNTPLFGTLAVDGPFEFSHCYSIYNGKTQNDRLVLTLLKGLEPKFYTASIVSDKTDGEITLITSSEGALLSEVNDRPIVDFLAELGLTPYAKNGYATFGMREMFLESGFDGFLPKPIDLGELSYILYKWPTAKAVVKEQR